MLFRLCFASRWLGKRVLRVNSVPTSTSTHEGVVTKLVRVNDSQLLAASDRGFLSLWLVPSGLVSISWQAHGPTARPSDAAILCVAVAPTQAGTLLLSSARSGTTRFWRLKPSLAAVGQLPCSAPVSSAHFVLREGRRLLLLTLTREGGQAGVRLWDCKRPERPQLFSAVEQLLTAELALPLPDGRFLLAGKGGKRWLLACGPDLRLGVEQMATSEEQRKDAADVPQGGAAQSQGRARLRLRNAAPPDPERSGLLALAWEGCVELFSVCPGGVACLPRGSAPAPPGVCVGLQLLDERILVGAWPAGAGRRLCCWLLVPEPAASDRAQDTPPRLLLLSNDLPVHASGPFCCGPDWLAVAAPDGFHMFTLLP